MLTDEQKKRKYLYDKQYYISNKNKINEYRNELSHLHKRKKVEDSKNEARKLNIDKEDELTFKAAVVFIYILKINHFNVVAIAKLLGYKFSEVKNILRNWKANKYYDNGKFYFNKNDYIETIVGFTLFCMCGAGVINRTEVL